MLNEILVGVQSVNDGTVTKARGGKQGDQIISGYHGPYYEQTYRGKGFHVASTVVETTSVGLNTTYTGLVLSNPITSPVNLVINKASVGQSVLQATQPEAYFLATGFNATTNVTHTTALTIRTNLIGSGLTSQATADRSAALPTAPFYTMFVTQTAENASDSTVGVVDIGGSIILMPGAYILWVTPAQASVAGMWFSFMWEEVPI